MTFLQKYLIPLVLLAIIIYLLLSYQSKIKAYKEEAKKHEKHIDSLNKVITVDLMLIEDLKKKDTIFVKEIVEIKTEADEKIKFVDTMSVSDMQSFYSKRYNKEE